MLNDAANGDFDGPAALVRHLRRQRRRPQPRVNHTEHLEREAGGQPNQDRKRLRLGDPNQPRRPEVPLRIADRALLQVEVRNFSRRKISSIPPPRRCLMACFRASRSPVLLSGRSKGSMKKQIRASSGNSPPATGL